MRELPREVGGFEMQAFSFRGHERDVADAQHGEALKISAWLFILVS